MIDKDMAEPEVKVRRRAVHTRPTRQKQYQRVELKLALDCLDYCRFLVDNANYDSLTAAIEGCIRESKAAQRITKL